MTFSTLKYEKKLKKMEKEASDEMEMAEKEA